MSTQIRPPRPRRRAWIATAAGLLAVLLGVALARFGRPPSARLDPTLMAVFPFRLTGTDTSSARSAKGWWISWR